MMSAQAKRRMSQSRCRSPIEALARVAIGHAGRNHADCGVPRFGLTKSIEQNHSVGATFAVMLFIRSYALHRLFQRWNWKAKPAEGAIVDDTL